MSPQRPSNAWPGQPEQAGSFQTNMLIGIGLVESIPIIASVIAIVLIFANPFVTK